MENKREVNQLIRDEAKTLKNKELGKNYYISDFTFRFKPSPAYRKDFKELAVDFLYKNKVITYYCFVNAKFNNEDAIMAAKAQIERLIDDGGITLYAKKYYHRIYK